MVREFKEDDINRVMELWLEANRQAHDFISARYWESNFEAVKEMLPQAELFVFEKDSNGEIQGFVGLEQNYIAGIFVRDEVRSKGIGHQLLEHIKARKNHLTLHVYQKNKRAITFYQREAFQIQRETMDQATGEKELLMVWDG